MKRLSFTKVACTLLTATALLVFGLTQAAHAQSPIRETPGTEDGGDPPPPPEIPGDPNAIEKDPKPTCEIKAVISGRKLACGDTASYRAVVSPYGGYVRYQWYVTGGTIYGSATSSTVRVKAGTGYEFSLSLRVTRNGITSYDKCYYKVPIVKPTCEVKAVNPYRKLEVGDTASYCVVVTPAKGVVTYDWKISGGATIVGYNTKSCVTIRVTACGSFNLESNALRNQCATTKCNFTGHVDCEPECEIKSVIAGRTLACGDTASYYATITPPGGTVTYQWSVTGGALLSSPSASVARVKAGSGASYTVSLTIFRNGVKCKETCRKTVTLVPVVCEVRPINPGRTLVSGDTATYCVSVTPPIQPGGSLTYNWQVAGNATIISNPTRQCVTVMVGTACTGFTIEPKPSRNYCGELKCAYPVPVICPPPCDIVPRDLARIFCGDTASFCAIVPPSGGTVTYLWTVTGGTINGPNNAQCVRVKANSAAELVVSLQVTRDGLTAPACSRRVPIVNAVCIVEPLVSGRALAVGDTATYCVRVIPSPQPGGTITTDWKVTGGAQIISAVNGSCVKVRVTAVPSFTLDPNVRRSGCELDCILEVPVRVDPPACEIRPLVSGSLACGDTATFCAVVTPPGGTVTYQWQVTGGQILTSLTDPCVRVRAGSGTEFTLTLTVTRDGVPGTRTCTTTIGILPVKCDIVALDPSRGLACGDTATFCASVDPPGGLITYQWAITGGLIEAGSTSSCVRVKVTGGTEFTLRLMLTRNNCPTECLATIPVRPAKCTITAVDPARGIACGDTATFYATVDPPGGVVTYQWSVTGGTIEAGGTSPVVRVRAGSGSEFTLSVTIRRNNCLLPPCDATIPLSFLKCRLVAVDETRGIACGDTATFRAFVEPAGGTLTYQWTITGGTIEAGGTSSAVRIKAGTGSEVTLTANIRRNNCLTTCELSIPLAEFKCDIVQVSPSGGIACGDTATFLGTVIPGGAGVTYQWTIVGGEITSSNGGAYVQVRAGNNGSFTLTLTARRFNCVTTCERIVAFVPLRCVIVPLSPDRGFFCGDTATFRVDVTPPGGGPITYEWRIEGGSIIAGINSRFVQIKAGFGTELTITAEARRGECFTSCDRVLPISQLKCEIVQPEGRLLACGDTATFCALVTPGDGPHTYEWSITGGTFVTSPFAQCVQVRAGNGNNFSLSVRIRRHSYLCVTECSITVPITAPTCEIIQPVPRTLSCGDTTSFCAFVYPPGGNVTYEWRVTGGTLTTPANGQCIGVRLGTNGSARIELRVVRNGCETTCERTVVFVPLTCEISAPPPDLSCTDTASFCVTVTPPGPATYAWTIINGAFLSPPGATGPCVTARVDSGLVTLRVRVTRNGCFTECERVMDFGVDFPVFSDTTRTTICANEIGEACLVSPPPTDGWVWDIRGGSFIVPPGPFDACVRFQAGTTGPVVIGVRGVEGECFSRRNEIVVNVIPPPTCEECETGYPDQSRLPMSKGVLDHDEVVKTWDPKTGGAFPCIVGDTLLRVFYSSDRAMLIGYRAIELRRGSSLIETRSYESLVEPANGVPMCIRNPRVGPTESTGDFRYGDWYERPVFPALWITDITDDPNSRAGDWDYKISAGLPDTGAIIAHKVCGVWKRAVRSYDLTRSGGPRATTVSDYPDPPKNFWNLGPGSDVPTEGFANVLNRGYGAEAAWNLTQLGLVPGRSYRLMFSLYEGGDNPHPNLGCINITVPGGTCEDDGSGAAQTAVQQVTTDRRGGSPVIAPEANMPTIDLAGVGLPKRFELQQNRPNPFNQSTTIVFAVPEASHVTIRVYTIAGQEVATIVDGLVAPGQKSIHWLPADRNGRALPPGVYLYKMKSESKTGVHQAMRKMVLLKK